MTISHQPPRNPDNSPPFAPPHLPASPSPAQSREWIKINPTMQGYLCCPAKQHESDRFNSVLFLGGSEGGTWPSMIEYLADLGYMALGVVYHQGKTVRTDCEGIPKDLARIELSGFKDAFNILQQHSAAGRHMGIIGCSRGGELALILGALYGSDANSQRHAGLSAIVSMVPSVAIFNAYSHDPSTNTRFTDTLEPAWLLNGLPYSGRNDDTQINLTNWRGRIPTEDISVPLFVVSGGKDNVWCPEPASPISSMPSLFDARYIIHHGKRNNVDDVAKHFPEAGHYFPPPYLLDSTEDAFLLQYGGISADAIRSASRDVNSALLAFLDKHLSKGPISEP